MGAIFKNFGFEEFELGIYFLEFSPHLKKIQREGNKNIVEVIEDAHEIGMEFVSVFLGVFAGNTRFVSWYKEERLLPWANDPPTNTAQIIEEIAAKQTSNDFDSEAWWMGIENIEGDPKLLARELAVAGLLDLDVFLEQLLFRGDLRLAMRQQISVYYWVTQVHAFLRERVLRTQTDVASIAANARHVENRAMKQQVWEWYQNNAQSYRSMDAAAEAAANKLVPVTFRTVREWIGQYQKSLNRPSPRRP